MKNIQPFWAKSFWKLQPKENKWLCVERQPDKDWPKRFYWNFQNDSKVFIREKKNFKQLEELIKSKVALLVANCSVICYVWQSEADIVLFQIFWTKKIFTAYTSPFLPWVFCYGLKIYFSIFHLYTHFTHEMSRGKGRLRVFSAFCSCSLLQWSVCVSIYLCKYVYRIAGFMQVVCVFAQPFLLGVTLLEKPFRIIWGQRTAVLPPRTSGVPWWKQRGDPASGAVELQFFVADIWADRVSQRSLHQEREWNLCCAGSARLSCI